MVNNYTDNKAMSAPSWGFAGWFGLSLAILAYTFMCDTNFSQSRQKRHKGRQQPHRNASVYYNY